MRPEAIVFDMDGTLALHTSGRNPYDLKRVKEDTPNQAVVAIAKRFAPHTLIIIVSAREDWCRDDTEAWLREHRIPYDGIYMRASGDFRKDCEIKEEIYRRDLEPHYNITFVVDDRNSVVKKWRELGLTCLQCAEGDF